MKPGKSKSSRGKWGNIVHALGQKEAKLKSKERSLERAKKELEISKKLYEDLYDVAPAGFITLTVEGIIREINLPAVRLLNHSRNHMLGQPLIRFIAESDRKKFAKFLADCRHGARTERLQSVELRLTPEKQSKPLLAELLAIPARESAGQEPVFRCLLRDVSHFRHMQEEQYWLAAIVESTDDAVIGIDPKGTIISSNRGATELYGYNPKELAGQSMLILTPPELHDQELKTFQRSLRGEDIGHYETVCGHKCGTHIDVLVTISPIRDAHGEIIGISKIARNITQRKIWEKELAESLVREQAANRAKDGFLAMLSHELRTPLSPVLLVASDLEKDIDLPPRARAGFSAIRKNIELEARLIDDLLDMNRIVHGKLNLEKSETDVEEILNDAVSTVEPELEEKNITLKVEFHAKSHKVIGDAVRLRQIFWNILKNAVKFSRKEGVITIRSESVDGERLQVTISDTGIGMEPDEIERLFDPFSQGRHTLGGMGLGLAISRGLVEFHGGTIHASSPGKGKGSTITIKLPAVKSRSEAKEAISHPSAVSPAIPPARKASTRILLIEDHESTRRALTQLLVRHRYKVTNAGSYAEACAIMESGDRFDVLISDIGLPDGNGYDLMVQFKQRFCGKGIALTGYGMEQDVSRSREAGFTTHLTKPVRMEALEAALAIALNSA